MNRLKFTCHVLVFKLKSHMYLGNLFSNVQLCPVCLSKPRDMAFGCGHQVRNTAFRFILHFPN